MTAAIAAPLCDFFWETVPFGQPQTGQASRVFGYGAALDTVQRAVFRPLGRRGAIAAVRADGGFIADGLSAARAVDQCHADSLPSII